MFNYCGYFLGKILWSNDESRWPDKKLNYFLSVGTVTISCSGGNSCLVVMRGVPCSKGCEFESQHQKLDGPFCTFTCKIVLLLEKRPLMNEKEYSDGP